MSFFRRLSRDRSSEKKLDFDPPQPQQAPATGNNKQYPPSAFRPGTSYSDTKLTTFKDSQFPSESSSKDMLNQYNNEQQYSTPQRVSSGMTNGSIMNGLAGNPATAAPDPNPLIWAFNESIKPYLEQIAQLRSEIASVHGALASANSSINTLEEERTSLHNTIQHTNSSINTLEAERSTLHSSIQHLEDERAALHNWIDKRGLRPDLPPALASTLPASAVSASTLSTQLDRKMTMLNYSLHHLADSAPEPLPTLTVTSTLSTLLPAISHLANLPTGPAFAFETLIKLAGNLNSHSTGEETDTDRANIAQFYDTLDNAMMEVIHKRGAEVQEGREDWDVAKDVNRLEKTGKFLRKEMAVQNYFVRSLASMRGGGHAQSRSMEGMERTYYDESGSR